MGIDNPEISVEELINRIRKEVNNLSNASSFENMCKELNPVQIEALISAAEWKSRVRTQLPRQLNRFPFNRSKALQRFVLKIFELLFYDQRSVNYSLIQALRESVKLNQKLNEQTTLIQAQITEVRNLIESTLKPVETVKNEAEAGQKQVD